MNNLISLLGFCRKWKPASSALRGSPSTFRKCSILLKRPSCILPRHFMIQGNMYVEFLSALHDGGKKIENPVDVGIKDQKDMCLQSSKTHTLVGSKICVCRRAQANIQIMRHRQGQCAQWWWIERISGIHNYGWIWDDLVTVLMVYFLAFCILYWLRCSVGVIDSESVSMLLCSSKNLRA